MGALCLLAAAIFAVHLAGGGKILHNPSSQLVLPDDEAMFTCTVQTDRDYYVYINGYPLIPNELPGVTISVSDAPNTDDVHVVTVTFVATLDLNTTTVQCAIDQYDGGQVSSIAYLWIAARPLPPNPSLTQFNATTLSISWMAPFTQTSVAGILNYTVRMFNNVSHQWKSWTVSASPPNTSSCHQADISEDIVHGCIDAFYRNNNDDEKRWYDSFQTFFVTKALPDFNCGEFIVYVSASNVLGESESTGIKGVFAIDPVHIKLEFLLNGTTASYDSLTISWNLLTFYTGDYNLSVMLSDGQAVNVPRGTLNYTFKGLNHDTCYNASVVAATGCSGVGLSASMVQCTIANPPAVVSISIIVQQDTRLPVQLQVVWSFNNDNHNGINYSVEINDVTVQVVSTNYVIWPIRVVPLYVVVSVSSISRAGKGPAGKSGNISGVILNTDIVNATLIHNNEVKCTFPRLTFHYCIVCCHVDPSVPPDSSVYNVSGTNSTVVAVVLTGLIAGQVHHCKVAATDDNRANCFSPVYRNIQTLIQIQPEQVSPVHSPSVARLTTENDSFSMVAITLVVTVLVVMFTIAASLIIIGWKRARECCFCRDDNAATTIVLYEWEHMEKTIMNESDCSRKKAEHNVA